MTVKKAYVELIEFLEANKQKNVKTILPQLIKMCEAKGSGGTGRRFIKDDDGNVTHVFCYYHKQWEDVTVAEYGKKKSNAATGLNTMCKEGLNAWSKQQRVFKAQESKLMDALMNKELTADEVAEQRNQAITARDSIEPRKDGHAVSFDA